MLKHIAWPALSNQKIKVPHFTLTNPVTAFGNIYTTVVINIIMGPKKITIQLITIINRYNYHGIDNTTSQKLVQWQD